MGETLSDVLEQFYAEDKSPQGILEAILDSSAVTEDDKRLAVDAKLKLAKFIRYWRTQIQITREIYDRPNATEPMPSMSQIVKEGRPATSIRVERTKHQEQIYPGTECTGKTEEGETIIPSEGFINNILRATGAIEKRQTYEAFKQYPKQSRIGTMNPVFWYDEYRPERPAYAHHIPLKIPGATMFLRADFPTKDSYPHELSMYVDIKTLEKLTQEN